MRALRYKAAHRGGPLNIHDHRLLATWAADCTERVLTLFRDAHPEDERPRMAVDMARAWSRGEISVGKARVASVEAHAAAREAQDGVARYAARAAGHAVATAHMADHAPRAAAYAVEAIRAAKKLGAVGAGVKLELEWQMERLPEQIRELVLSTRA